MLNFDDADDDDENLTPFFLLKEKTLIFLFYQVFLSFLQFY